MRIQSNWTAPPVPAREVTRGAAVGDQGTAVRGRYRSYESETKFELKVKTDEGDVVTIKIARSTEAESGRVRGGGVRYNERRVSSSESASIEIEGDISETEAADIKKLLDSLGSRGDQSADLASLESYSMNYSQTSSYEKGRFLAYV